MANTGWEFKTDLQLSCLSSWWWQTRRLLQHCSPLFLIDHRDEEEEEVQLIWEARLSFIIQRKNLLCCCCHQEWLFVKCSPPASAPPLLTPHPQHIQNLEYQTCIETDPRTPTEDVSWFYFSVWLWKLRPYDEDLSGRNGWRKAVDIVKNKKPDDCSSYIEF